LLDKDTSPLFESVEVTKEQEELLVKILNYMELFLYREEHSKEIINKMRAKTHLVSLGYMAYLAIIKGMNEDDYAAKVFTFFNTDDRKPSINENYNIACASGGAKPEKVLERLKALDAAILA
jgi:hypothetical protein